MALVHRFRTTGPPNSPPTTLERRSSKIVIATNASVQNRVTQNAKLKIKLK